MATSAAKQAKEQIRGKEIQIVEPEISIMVVDLELITPFLSNPLTKQYVDEQLPGAVKTKGILEPEEAYKAKLKCRMLNGKYYIPVEMFTGNNGVFIAAARGLRIKKVSAGTVQNAVSVKYDVILDAPEGLRPCVELVTKGPKMDFHMASVDRGMGQRVPIAIYRPRFDDGQVQLRIEYWSKLVNQNALMSLITAAGGIGIGAYHKGGYGKFRVTRAIEVQGR